MILQKYSEIFCLSDVYRLEICNKICVVVQTLIWYEMFTWKKTVMLIWCLFFIKFSINFFFFNRLLFTEKQDCVYWKMAMEDAIADGLGDNTVGGVNILDKCLLLYVR